MIRGIRERSLRLAHRTEAVADLARAPSLCPWYLAGARRSTGPTRVAWRRSAPRALPFADGMVQFQRSYCEKPTESILILSWTATMLIEFRLENFRSYAAQKRFSMVAGAG